MAAAFVFPGVAMLIAVALGFAALRDGLNPWMLFATVVLTILALVLTLAIVRSMNLPRLAFESGFLLVYLCGRQPVRVPIDAVEVFFLGQGPSLIRTKDGGPAETSTIVVRLAESAPEWHNREVDASLGQWADGYIVIRGTWCEPIDAELMQRLNRRLVEAHRRQRHVAMQDD